MANILVIDDDLIYANMLTERLRREGHAVTLQAGPFGGTVAASRPDLDLIILDVFMPGLNGPDLLALIRKGQGTVRPKVILTSSMDVEPLRELAVTHQADGYIPKSAGRTEVLESVAAVLAQ